VRTRYRIMTVSAIAGVAVAALAGPASAHVEVSADKTQAGATDVTLTFNGEAENPKAGIQSERVVLPTGIAPAGVTLVSAPAGWTFTSAADGFTVAGKALKIGTNAVWKVKIAKLPAGQTRLSFKTLETYGNGDISRWIEIQLPGQNEPDNPAPLLTLKPGAAPSTPAPSEAASPTPDTVPTATAPLVALTRPPVQTTSSGSSTWWIWVVVAALVAVAGGLFVLRRRRGTDPS
jgi:uncharacterized protein YcnI